MARLTKAKQRAIEVALRLLFTRDEQRAVQQAADAVWNEIAYDLLTEGGAVQEQDAKSVRRAVVLEVVCDAGRLEDRIRDKQLAERVHKLGPDEVYALVKPAFPYEWYGI